MLDELEPQIRLTDEEIKDIKLTKEECRELVAKSEEYKPKEFRGLYENEEHRLMLERKIAKVQLKKVGEWGGSVCTDRTHSGTMKKRECGFCWRVLLEEIKEV